MTEIDALAKARHGMSVLWDEITATRERVAAFLTKLEQIMSNHDETKSLLAECETLADTLIGAKEDGDAKVADLKTDATALRDKMKAAVAALTAEVDGTGSGSLGS